MRRIAIVLAVLLGALSPAVDAGSDGRIAGVVTWIDDGDTIEVRIGERQERVRYIGLDAPEVPHHGEGGTPGGVLAADVNRALVGGRHVTLELDAEPRDRYGRLLAYVWVGDTMVNLEMVRRGYARALTIPPNLRYWRSFKAAERDARREGSGLWQDGGFRTPRSVARPKG